MIHGHNPALMPIDRPLRRAAPALLTGLFMLLTAPAAPAQAPVASPPSASASAPAEARADAKTGATADARPKAPADTGGLAAQLARWPQVEQLWRRGEQQAAVQALLALEPQYSNDANYYQLLGVLELEIGRPADAQSHLERVVLIQPDNAGAWLDLAIATLQLGDSATADAYLDHVEREFPPVPALAPVLRALRQKTRVVRGSTRDGWIGVFETEAGHASNANTGLGLGAIDLTLAGNLVSAPIDPAFRARADQYAQAGLKLLRSSGTGTPTQIGLLLVGRQRFYFRETASNQSDIGAGVNLIHGTGWGDWRVGVQAERLDAGNDSVLTQARLVLGLERPLGAAPVAGTSGATTCRWGAGTELARRNYSGQPSLDASLLWLQGSIGCRAHDWRFDLIARGARDDPRNLRAGGVTQRRELQFAVGTLQPGRLNWDLSLVWSRARDREGYSPLLADGAVRRQQFLLARLEAAWPGPYNGDWTAALESNLLRSNIDLFRRRGSTLSFGYRYAF